MSEATFATDGSVFVITMSNPPVNGLGHELREGISNVIYVEIPSNLGHMAQNPLGVGSDTVEHQFVDAAIATFLASL